MTTGLKGGAEAAIHSMRQIFEQDETDGVVLVDASNAFNRINRNVALHNIRITAPAFATILVNTYRKPSRLFITGGGEIASQEGTTQGDNLAMSFYGLSTCPLQNELSNAEPTVKQVWLADDATGAGRLRRLRRWWDLIVERGALYGYYVNEDKSWLILRDPNLLEEAREIFAGTGIKFTTDGKRHLGAALGSADFRREYAEEKVSEWCAEIKKLSDFAVTQPHAAFSAFINGEQHKFRYFMRTIPGMEQFLKPLDEIIFERFLPAILDSPITDLECALYALPIRDGGLGISNFADLAQIEFTVSTTVTAPLAAIIVMQGTELPDADAVRELFIPTV